MTLIDLSLDDMLCLFCRSVSALLGLENDDFVCAFAVSQLTSWYSRKSCQNY